METFSALLDILSPVDLSPVNSPYKGQWRGALMYALISVCTNVWINNPAAGDLGHHRTHYDITVMLLHWYVAWRQAFWQQVYNGINGGL